MKCLLRFLMVAHGLLGLDPASRIAGLALFGSQGFASEGKVFSHAVATRWWGKGSTSAKCRKQGPRGAQFRYANIETEVLGLVVFGKA